MVSGSVIQTEYILQSELLPISSRPCAETFSSVFCAAVYGKACVSRRFVWGFEQTLETPQLDLKLSWSLIRDRWANAHNQQKVPPTRGKNGWGGRRYCLGATKNARYYHNFTDWAINIFGLRILSALIKAKDHKFLASLTCFVLKPSQKTSKHWNWMNPCCHHSSDFLLPTVCKSLWQYQQKVSCAITAFGTFSCL